MKYKIGIIILAFGFSGITFGQFDSPEGSNETNLVSKKGIYILPEKGDLAIGIDAWPFLNYLGNLMSTSGSWVPYVDYPSHGNLAGIYAKYMLASDLALRANFRCDLGSYSDVYVVPQSALLYDPQSPQYVEDVVTTTNNYITLGVGIEKMRGKSRVQGKYGAELLFGYDKRNAAYNYGNSITNEFNRPATFNNLYYDGGERIINDYIDKGLFIGARGFLGAEFFIGPKISIGGEFGYSFIYQWSQNRITEYQYWDSSAQQVSTVIRQTNRTGFDNVSVGIDNLDGAITLFLYF